MLLPLTASPLVVSGIPAYGGLDRTGLLGNNRVTVDDRSCESPCGRFWRYLNAEHPTALLVTGVVVGGIVIAVVPATVTYIVTKDYVKTFAVVGAAATALTCVGNAMHARADRLGGRG